VILRALRKILLDIFEFGIIIMPFVLVGAWALKVSLLAGVLGALAASGMIVAMLVMLALSALPFQYWRHRKALRNALRRRGALPEQDRQRSLTVYRMELPSPSQRDPRVIPWWEW
jgi:hypothetical protein